ncbi:L-threonine 3-dehydrogenase [Streptomyces fumanus]
MARMLAARLHVPSRTLRVEEVPRPQPGPGEVLVKVEAAGVCLSDVHLIDGTLTPLYLQGDTVTLGHEVSGTVAETGEGVTAWSPGQRVVLHAGEKRDGVTYTRGVDYDGGWAEYALSAADALTALPDAIPFDQGAIIPDAVSTPWGAITETGAVRPAEAVGVWGVGGLGVHAVQLLRAAGACPVIAVDPNPVARERALAAGADLALDSADPGLRRAVGEATGGAGIAAAFDFAGVPAVREQAVSVPRAPGPAGPGGADQPAPHGHRRHPLQLPPAAHPRPLRLRHAGGAAAVAAADRPRAAGLLRLHQRRTAAGRGRRGGRAAGEGGQPDPADPAPVR